MFPQLSVWRSLINISSISTKEIDKLFYYKFWLLFWNPMSRQRNNCAIDVFSQSLYSKCWSKSNISSKCWIEVTCQYKNWNMDNLLLVIIQYASIYHPYMALLRQRDGHTKKSEMTIKAREVRADKKEVDIELYYMIFSIFIYEIAHPVATTTYLGYHPIYRRCYLG